MGKKYECIHCGFEALLKGNCPKCGKPRKIRWGFIIVTVLFAILIAFVAWGMSVTPGSPFKP